VTASSNPWFQVYKLDKRKVRTNSIMNTLRKPDDTETKYTRDNEYNVRSSHHRRQRRRNLLP